ncbi:MAG TPA: tetratricopeptide repeat protein [Tepidisphaeraceae bacterium]|jgi:Tfp pilus assembly protein PilF|nr:tetratricopeptide repeat protein [Tepidisphaeraceae bacterium]
MRRFAYPCVASGIAIAALLGCQPSNSNLPAVSDRPSERAVHDLQPADSATVCLSTARRLEQSGYPKEAIAQYERARQFNQALPLISRRLAVLYDREGDDARAAAEYGKALDEQPGDPDILNDEGYFYASRADWVMAEKYLRAAIAVNPRLTRAWINLGIALAGQRRYADSLVAFSTVVTAAAARSNVGLLMAQQGDDVQAEDMLLQAISLDPTLVPPRMALDELAARKRSGRTPAGIRSPQIQKPSNAASVP